MSKTKSNGNSNNMKSTMKNMMASAQAHKEASVLCHDEGNNQNPPTGRTFFLNVVSFEMILLSIEQSMKLSLMLHFSHTPDKTHDIYDLFNDITDKSGNLKGLQRKILSSANKIGSTQDIPTISEDELKKIFKRHKSSYLNVRYFGLDKQFQSQKWEIRTRDIQVMHCIAWGFVDVNSHKMQELGINPFSLGEAQKIPESEMTDELKKIKQRILTS